MYVCSNAQHTKSTLARPALALAHPAGGASSPQNHKTPLSTEPPKCLGTR